MKVVLVGPVTKKTFKWELRQPLGIAYLGAVLRQEGFNDIYLFDPCIEVLSQDELIDKIIQKNPRVLGITTLTNTLQETINVLKGVKRENSKIKTILGGPHPSIKHKELLRKYDFVDFVIRGEGEYELPRLIKYIENGQPRLKQIKGLSYRNDNEEIECNPNNKQRADLEELPLPARDLLPSLTEYGNRGTLLSSRGCPYECSFCSVNHTYGGSDWRSRSPKDVVFEFKELVNSYGAKHIGFADDNFLTSPERAKKICSLLEEEELQTTFSFGARPDQIVSSEYLLPLLKRSGCSYIEMGIENGAQSVLNRYNKSLTIREIEGSIELLREYNIDFVADFILFDPETTFSELEKNINFLERNNLLLHDEIFENSLYLVPGTQLYRHYLSQGLIKRGEYGTHWKFKDRKVRTVFDAFVQHFLKSNEEERKIHVKKAENLIKKASNNKYYNKIDNLIAELNISLTLVKLMPFRVFKKIVKTVGAEKSMEEILKGIKSKGNLLKNEMNRINNIENKMINILEKK